MFRSLFLDYKAEALQIMREAKEEEEAENLRKRVGDNETNAMARSRQNRVIRILVDPEEEAVPDNVDDEEEIPSADSQELPFWLSEAISNPKEEGTDEEDTHVNKVATPVSKPTSDNITIGGDDYDSMDISGSNDANVSDGSCRNAFVPFSSLLFQPFSQSILF